jgi:hypothetical protein
VWGQDGAAITRKDLSEVKANFAGRPPLTLGHIPPGQIEGPRYGRVLSVDLAEDGNLLLGKVEFGDSADEAFAKGLYDGWSVSIPRRGKDGGRYLHHLALLGMSPPKIPGLKEVDTVSYEYADGDEVETLSFGGAITERKEESELDPKELEELRKKHAELEAEHKKLLEEKAKLLEEKAAAEKAVAEVGAGAKTGEDAPGADGGAEGADFADRLAKMEGEVRKSRVAALMAKVEGKIPTGVKDKVKGLAERIAGDDESFNFSDSGKNQSAKAVELLGDILALWPAPVKTGGGEFDFADPETGKAPDWGKVAAGM